MDINGAQIHLALNHFPVVLSWVVFSLLTWSYFFKNVETKKLGLIFAIIAAAFAAPAFYSGEFAEDILKKWPEFSKDLIHEHEEAGELAFIISIVAGLFSAAALFFSKTKLQLSKAFFIGALIVSGIASVAFLRAAHLGGQIHHQEIRSSQ